MNGKWGRFCVVGIGSHARTKLIPAILANGQELAGLVSRQPASALPNAPMFARIEDALAALPNDTAFLLASPPTVHALQAPLILAAKRDLVVEKPAFVTARDARAVANLANAAGAVLAEAFMQRHTSLHAWWLEHWASRRADVTALDATFVVPALPAATFRADAAIGASSLFDIGCYVVALLNDLGLDHSGLSIVDVVDAGALTERVTLAGELDGIAITATIGVAPEYANRVTLRLRNGDSTTATPFFFGRSGERRIDMVRNGIADAVTLSENDAFRAMLARPRAEWLADQSRRLAALVAATATLQRLGGELAASRLAAH